MWSTVSQRETYLNCFIQFQAGDHRTIVGLEISPRLGSIWGHVGDQCKTSRSVKSTEITKALYQSIPPWLFMIFVYMGEICSSRNPEQLKHYVIYFFCRDFFPRRPESCPDPYLQSCNNLAEAARWVYGFNRYTYIDGPLNKRRSFVWISNRQNFGQNQPSWHPNFSSHPLYIVRGLLGCSLEFSRSGYACNCNRTPKIFAIWSRIENLHALSGVGYTRRVTMLKFKL